MESAQTRSFLGLLGESTLERKGRFFLGSGILVLAVSWCAVAIYEMDKMVMESSILGAPSLPDRQTGNAVIQREAGGRVASSEAQYRLNQAKARRRAELITFALVSSILAMLYLYVILHYVLTRTDQEKHISSEV
jgi:hypothetical protein